MEIKLLACDKSTGELLEVNRINLNKDSVMFKGCNINADKSEYHIMPYIGIKDINNNPIHLGHIVLWRNCQYEQHKDVKYEVIWQTKKCGFGLRPIKGQNLYYDRIRGITHGKNLEIIGVIYEKENKQ